MIIDGRSALACRVPKAWLPSRSPAVWRINGHHLVALVRAGATFEKGVLIENQFPKDQVAA